LQNFNLSNDLTIRSRAHATAYPATSLASVGGAANGSIETLCVRDLLAAQNDDGGFGFHSGQQSAIEPTGWVLLSIAGLNQDHPLSQQKLAGVEFLRSRQLPDGSWPAVTGDQAGGWVTSLACLALQASEGSSPAADAGLEWLCGFWPGEGNLWWRIRHRVFGKSHLVGQDHQLRGWSWTQGTSSWVEPTSFALLALRHAKGSARFLDRVEERCDLAQRMLCDRMCPGGGWNSGNPLIYGAAGNSLIGPTCWVMAALSEFAFHEEPRRGISESLAWLERTYLSSRGPASLALAHLCLNSFGRRPRSIGSQLAEMYERNQFLGHVPTLAWVLLATQPTPRWFSIAEFRTN
jgi:hypothetical protein